MQGYTQQKLVLCTIIALICLLTACASTYQARDTYQAGFLRDYSMLQPGGKDRALLRYVNPQADFKAYNAIWMDPVRLYASGKHEMEKLTAEDRHRILDYADATIREQLSVDYTLVEEPGPGVMHLRIAITEAEGARVVLDTVSTVIPIGLAASAAAALATGKWGFTGRAGLEVDILDSMTDVRLAAVVDRRTGGKVTGKGDKLKGWRTVKNSLDYWANKMRERLAEARGVEQNTDE